MDMHGCMGHSEYDDCPDQVAWANAAQCSTWRVNRCNLKKKLAYEDIKPLLMRSLWWVAMAIAKCSAKSSQH